MPGKDVFISTVEFSNSSKKTGQFSSVELNRSVAIALEFTSHIPF